MLHPIFFIITKIDNRKTRQSPPSEDKPRGARHDFGRKDAAQPAGQMIFDVGKITVTLSGE